MQLNYAEANMHKVAAVLGSMALTVATVATADDQSRTLKGQYAFSTSASCVFSSAVLSPVYIPPAGFTPSFVPIGHASANSFSSNGVLTFNGDGTGSQTARTVTIGDPDPGDSGATNVIDNSSSFTYTVSDDGTFTFVQGPITSDFVGGPRVGIQTVTSGVPAAVGHVSSDKKTLVFGSFDPAVESTLRVDLGVVESVRICHRSNTSVRIGSDSDN
jgi:hypothetical protein